MKNLTQQTPKFSGTIKKAFTLTVPVLTGYAFLGIVSAGVVAVLHILFKKNYISIGVGTTLYVVLSTIF